MIRSSNEIGFSEQIILDSFLYAAMVRMLTFPDDARVWPDFWPMLKAKGSNEAVEYVIIRPFIENNMLGIIMGRGGGEELKTL